MRYLRWGKDGEAVQLEKGLGVGNCLKCAQNPQRQVHALFGGVSDFRLAGLEKPRLPKILLFLSGISLYNSLWLFGLWLDFLDC